MCTSAVPALVAQTGEESEALSARVALLTTRIVTLLAAIFMAAPAIAGPKIGPLGYDIPDSTAIYPSAAQACAALYESSEAQAEDAGDGDVKCKLKQQDGNEISQIGSGLVCPAFADPKGLSDCECRESYKVSRDGAECIPENSVDTTVAPVTPRLDAAKKKAICEQLGRTLAATIGEPADPEGKTRIKDLPRVELPPSRTNNATVTLGMILSSTGKEHMVAGASSISGAETEKPLHQFYAHGIKKDDKSHVTPCDGKIPFVYQRAANAREGHAESKIIEDWFRDGARGSVLVLKIGASQSEACKQCDSLIQFINGSSGKAADCPRVEVCP